MAVPGRLNWCKYGIDQILANQALAGGTSTVAMAALNSGWCARFIAEDTRDIASVYFNWSSVASAGTVTLRIETIDATTGKPSGSLYDANASLAFTPVAGWQLCTFASLPTTGLTAGTEYAIVLLTTTGGTTQTLRSSISGSANSRYPAIVLTAADGTTRSNFAEVAGSVPICSVVYEDSVEELMAFCQFTTTTAYNAFGTAATGLKFVVPSGLTLSVAGVEIAILVRTGTPAGDLRLRIFNSSDSAVAGTTVTVDKDSLLNVNNRRTYFPFVAPVSLAAGTYRVVFDSASSANSSNCWTIRSMVARASSLVPAEFAQTSTADVTAGTISWTDTAAEQAMINLILDDVTGGSSGGVTVPTMFLGGEGVFIGA